MFKHDIIYLAEDLLTSSMLTSSLLCFYISLKQTLIHVVKTGLVVEVDSASELNSRQAHSYTCQ